MNGLVTRAEWEAKAPTSASVPFDWPNVKGLAIHYTDWPYDFSHHANCAPNLRSLQQNAFNRSYRDIEYNYLVCSHGYVFEGRTFSDMSGANGVTTGNYANLDYGAVSFMSDGSLDPAPVGDCFRWVRDKLLTYQAKAVEVWPHQHFVATSCPGDRVVAWLKTNPFSAPNKEDEVKFFQKQGSPEQYLPLGGSLFYVSAEVWRAYGSPAPIVLPTNDPLWSLPVVTTPSSTPPPHSHAVTGQAK